MNRSSFFKSLITPLLVTGLFFGLFVFAAWQPPSDTPPYANVAAPINVGDTAQEKTGSLMVKNLTTTDISTTTGGFWLYKDDSGEGNINRVSHIIGLNDLFLWGDPNEQGVVHISGSELKFWSGGIERWKIDSAGKMSMGTLPWSGLTDFPNSCPAGQYVKGVGSTLTCVNGIDGEGIINYIPRWTSTTSLATSVIYQAATTGNIGIDNTNPGFKLDVNGSIRANGNLTLTGLTNPCSTLGTNSSGDFLCGGPAGGYAPADANYLVYPNFNNDLLAEKLLMVESGSGLSLSGLATTVTISTNFNTIQKRVTGSCVAGSSISAVATSGTVTCETDDSGIGGSGTATSVAFFTGPTTLSSDSNLSWNNTGKKLGVRTANPYNAFEIATGFSFNDEGHKVIGFGYAPGVDISLINGYPFEIRLDPGLGKFSIGNEATSRVPGQAVIIATRMTIDKDGLLTLRRTTAGTVFAIRNTADITNTFTISDTGAAYMTGFRLGTSATSSYVLTADSSGYGTWKAAAGGGGAGGWTDDGTMVRLTTSTDSVGIGIATPTTKLQVVGGSISTTNAFYPGNGSIQTTNGLAYNSTTGYLTMGSTEIGGQLDMCNQGISNVNNISGYGGTLRLGSDLNFNAYNITGDGLIQSTSTGNNYFLGNVGIGTMGPEVLLDVSGGTTAGDRGIEIDAFSPGDPFLGFEISGNRVWTLGVDDSDGDKLMIGTTGINTNTRFTIDSSGNVGIGTTNPSGALQVVGNVYLQNIRWVVTTNTSPACNSSTEGWMIYAYEGAPPPTTYATGIFFCKRTGSATYQWNKLSPVADTPNSDIAEFIYSLDSSVEAGDVVAIELNENVAVGKTTASERSFGIISTNPALVLARKRDETGGLPRDYSNEEMFAEGYRLLALSGRIPAKVHLKPGEILENGDYITGSNILAGFAMKVTKAGKTIGEVLEKFDPTTRSCHAVNSVNDIIWPEDDGTNPQKPCFRLPDGSFVGKIMLFLNISWYDPDMSLTDSGEIAISSLEGTSKYQLENSQGDLINRIGRFSEAVIANLKTGLIETKKLIVDGIDVLKKLNELEGRVQEQEQEIRELRSEVEKLNQ